MKEKTAVDYLFDCIIKEIGLYDANEKFEEHKKVAQQLFRQQIEAALDNGRYVINQDGPRAAQMMSGSEYYTKTYGE